jgi:hypothetical protein
VAQAITYASTTVPSPQQLDARLNVLDAQRITPWMRWGHLARYFLPRRMRWLVIPNDWAARGLNINGNIIDNTGTRAIRTLAAGLMSGLTSPDRPWFALTLPDPDLANSPAVKLWLDEVQRRIMRIMAESNFYLGMSVLYEDLACFGTACMIIYEDFRDVIRCFNPCIGEFYLAQNARLEVDTMFRKYTNTARQMEQQFGTDALGESAKKLLESGQGAQDTERVIGHAIEPNDDPGGPKPSGKLPWREVYWEVGASGEEILQERGFHEFPCICPRWYVAANDVYGRGPADDALGDQKQLQVEQRRKAQAIDKMVNPPLLAPNGLRNEPMSMLPGGVTFMSPQDLQAGGAKPAYQVEPQLRDMLVDIQDVQGRIKETLYYDLFLMLANLPPTTERTATEILERKQEKLLMLSPMLERMFTEGLDPAVRRVAKIAARAGLFPPMPSEMRGHSVEIQYTSALAIAQKSVATTGIERLVGFIGSIAGVHPEVADKGNFLEMVDQYNDLLGNSPKLLNSDAVVAQRAKQRAAQQESAAQAQQAMATVQGAKTLSQTDTGAGQNALQMILNGAQGAKAA